MQASMKSTLNCFTAVTVHSCYLYVYCIPYVCITALADKLLKFPDFLINCVCKHPSKKKENIILKY